MLTHEEAYRLVVRFPAIADLERRVRRREAVQVVFLSALISLTIATASRNGWQTSDLWIYAPTAVVALDLQRIVITAFYRRRAFAAIERAAAEARRMLAS